jgi:predicted DCC family thiol-disulfide oxidoreductase YuxK
MTPAPPATILYHRDCSFCRWSADRILAWDRGRLAAVPIQSEEGGRLLAPIPEDRRLDSWHLLTADGELHSAGEAAAPLAELLPGGRPLAALFRAFPGATERSYRWVSSHRERLARLLRIDPACDVRPPSGGSATRRCC